MQTDGRLISHLCVQFLELTHNVMLVGLHAENIVILTHTIRRGYYTIRDSYG